MQRSIITLAGIILSIVGLACEGAESDAGRHEAGLDSGATPAEQTAPAGAETQADPHRHSVDVLTQEPDTAITHGFAIVAVDPPKGQRENVTPSPDGRYRAFTTADSAGFRIFVEETRIGAVRELAGLPLEYRPFDDLVWTGPTVLVFDRWSQPHFGVHYAVDVASGRLLLTSRFPG